MVSSLALSRRSRLVITIIIIIIILMKAFLEARLKQLNVSMQQSKKVVCTLETMGYAEMGIINEFLFVSRPKQQTFHDMILMIQQSQSLRQTSRRLYELYGLEFLRERILEYRFSCHINGFHTNWIFY